MATFWELYDEARKEVQANIDTAINEAYILKLEERIEELEQKIVTLNDTASDASDDPTREQMRSFVRVLNDEELTSSRAILKIKLVRAAFNLTLAEAKSLIDEVTAEDDLPF
jgi:ribosomal protein L7/L12